MDPLCNNSLLTGFIHVPHVAQTEELSQDWQFLTQRNQFKIQHNPSLEWRNKEWEEGAGGMGTPSRGAGCLAVNNMLFCSTSAFALLFVLV